MIALRLCWLVLAVCLAGLVAATGSSLYLSLLVVLLAVPLLTWPWNILAGKRLRAAIRLPVNLIKGQAGAGVLQVENRSRLPILRLCCCIEAENCLTGRTQVLRASSFVLPGQTQEIPLRVGDTSCGRVKLRLQSVVLYDCFGLVPVKAAVEGRGAVTVQPNTFEQNLSLSLRTGVCDEAETYSQERPGQDRSEIFQIREYQEGDSVRQIHWKLSTKLDRPVIREPSLPIVRSVLIFWERAVDRPETLAEIDAQAEVVASVCRNLLSRSVQFTLGWNDTRENRLILQEIRDMDALIGILPRLLSARGREAAISGGALLAQSAAAASHAHLIYVSGSGNREVLQLQDRSFVTLLLCGGQEPDKQVHGYAFTPDGYTEQLMELEL